MDVIVIESKAFQKLVDRLERVEHVLSNTMGLNIYPLKDRWLDNQEAMEILHCCKRQLQYYRDNKKIPFSQIRGKIYYKASDVEEYFNNHIKNKAAKKSNQTEVL